MRYCDHDVSLFVSLLNVLESFRDPLQGITSVDDRPELPGRDEFCDETHSLQVVDSHPALDLLSTSDGGPKGPHHVGQLHDALKEDTVRFQRVLATVKRRRADDVEYQVVAFSILREIVPGVVDHHVGTQGLHQLDVRAAADPGHRRAKVFGQLHSGRADGPRSSNDQELLSGSDLSQVLKEVQRGVRSEWNGNGFLPTQ